MDRRRFLGQLGLAACAAPWLAACAAAPPLAVAIHPWVGYETLYLARAFKWLPEAVHLREGKTLGDSLAALKAGKADAACLTLDEVLGARAEGMPLSVALVFDVSAGADAVLGRPGIDDLASLRGKRLGFEQNALGALMLQKLLDASGLREADLILLDLPPDRQIEAWRDGGVDAVITYEPTATLLQKEGATRLFDSRDMPEAIFDVLAVHRERVRDTTRLQALVASHFLALDHMRRNAEDALYRIAANEGITPDEARQVLAGVNTPSLAANRAYLLGDDSHFTRAARELSRVMVRHRLLAREDDLRELILRDTLPGEGR